MQHKLQYYSLILQILLQITNANNTYKCDNNNCRSSKTITINVNVNNNYLSGLGICSSVFRANCSFFAQKWANEQFAQKMSDSLIRSFLLSDLSDLLMITHFLWATMSESLMVAHFFCVTWAICSHCSNLVRDLSDSLTSLTKKEEMSNSLIF